MSETTFTPRTTRTLLTAFSLLAGLALGVCVVLERPFLGVAGYALAMLGAVGLQYRSDAVLFDERDRAISSRASGLTLRAYGYAAAVVFPALTVAWGLGYFDWPAWSVALALAVAALYLTYGGLHAAIVARS